MSKHFAAMAIAGLLGACTPLGSQTPAPMAKAAPSDADRISYAIGPCRGFCPAYSFEIAADGIAFFQGEQHSKVAGRVSVDGDPMLFRKIKESLAAIRPAATDQAITHEGCAPYATDQQTVTVTWTWNGDQQRSLSYDLGCRDPRFETVRAALSATRRLLPIDDLVGRATEF